MNDLTKLTDQQLSKLIENKWASSSTLWDEISSLYDKNKNAYKNEPEWLKTLAKKKSKVRDNRIFVNTEAVINSVIANPPKPNVVPSRDTPESRELATLQQKYFSQKYTDRNVKEAIRKGLRNLYFARLLVLKPFWNSTINDFDVRSLDPRNVRFSSTASKEEDSAFAIEEVPDTLHGMVSRFPSKKKEILAAAGFEVGDEKNLDTNILLDEKQYKYKEAWIGNYLICKFDDVIMCKVKNPYWDWDGRLMTAEQSMILSSKDSSPVDVKNVLSQIKSNPTFSSTINKAEKPEDSSEGESEADGDKGEFELDQDQAEPGLDVPDPEFSKDAYFYNHFNFPRKPYIFATIFADSDSPIGSTDFITQAIPLQTDIDETKRNITENARIVNGMIKVDSSVMTQEEATKLNFKDAGGIVYGKGVANGVQRETGAPLPSFVQMNLEDSRKEIDDIMASSSAFRGVREGQETRAGRLALIDQSFLRLNELVQVVDYVNNELFNWFYQLAKINYTENHYAKIEGRDGAIKIIELMQDDFETGTEVKIIPGKTLPEDRQFKFEQAQKDMEMGVLAPIDYYEAAGYENGASKLKNLVTWGLNQAAAAGLTQEEIDKLSPPKQEEKPLPKTSIKYEDLPPDGKVQLASQVGIELDPEMVVNKDIAERKDNVKIKNIRPGNDKVSMASP